MKTIVKVPHLLYLFIAEQWKPIDPEEKKRYDREFLLRFQFSSASMHKPEGLPIISDVVLDKVVIFQTHLLEGDPLVVVALCRCLCVNFCHF